MDRMPGAGFSRSGRENRVVTVGQQAELRVWALQQEEMARFGRPFLLNDTNRRNFGPTQANFLDSALDLKNSAPSIQSMLLFKETK